ncbi:MAG: nucleotidyl transferase AbiEii/AbiGii toxin family protein, partial [Candidatus Omnitrophica bacterium]|nr:nucleotidyl transferase AbiEii/AbiGii toxin family protein [Candidatus Omnitrophota bacterium]
MEYLLEEAKSNALPVIKKRAIVREYLQIMALSSIYNRKFGRHFFFMGGTAMRYFYRMPRFSEDLDFNTSGLGYQEFEDILEIVKEDISKEGFSVTLSCAKRNNLFTANLIFYDVIEKYSISDKRGMNLMIKVEINKPNWELITESKVLSMYGYNFTAILMSKGNLLSEKLCALFNRKRGRDIYDTLFMLKRKFPFNENVLKANNISLPVKDTILSYLKSMNEKELKQLAFQVKPFLFKEDEIDLILKAPLYGENFLADYV